MPLKKIPTSNEVNVTIGHNCNESEVRLMLAIMQQIARPRIDFDALAVTLGASTANAARVRVSAATNKHGWFSAAAATGDSGGSRTPRAKASPGSGGGRKKKAPVEEDEIETPAKKRARSRDTKANPKLENEDDNGKNGGEASGYNEESGEYEI